MWNDLFIKQLMMRKVIYALLPLLLLAVLIFGFRVLFLLIFVCLLGVTTEYLMEKRLKKKVSEAVLVSCLLYTLSLPSHTPFWIAGVGIIFGILFAKEVYGGFGRNIFNPAITARLFVYISFPNVLTQNWSAIPFSGDAITSATPLMVLRSGESFNFLRLFFGWHSGSMGELSIFLIILGAIYLVKTKTASLKIILSTLASAFFFIVLFRITTQSGLPVFSSFFSGSIFFVAVFMATDPITAPKQDKAKMYYGILIGAVIVIVRTFSLFPEGTSFGLMTGNICASLFDNLVKKKKIKKD